MLRQILLSTRPRQWLKNVFVFPALIFSHHLLEWWSAIQVIGAFVCFVGLSGAIYLINDLLDIEQDRIHPRKSKRPLASGSLSLSTARVSSILIISGAIFLAFILNFQFGCIASIYVVLNVAYSVRLKHVVLLDVICVAAGYLLRAVGGAVVIDVQISTWFILCIFNVTLFIATTKRRQELVHLHGQAAEHRQALQEYSLPFLDQLISVLTSATLVCYALYAMGVGEEAGAKEMRWTIPFVLYGVFRYLFLVYRREEGAEPEDVVWRDRPLQITILSWLAASLVGLYAN